MPVCEHFSIIIIFIFPVYFDAFHSIAVIFFLSIVTAAAAVVVVVNPIHSHAIRAHSGMLSVVMYTMRPNVFSIHPPTDTHSISNTSSA